MSSVAGGVSSGVSTWKALKKTWFVKAAWWKLLFLMKIKLWIDGRKGFWRENCKSLTYYIGKDWGDTMTFQVERFLEQSFCSQRESGRKITNSHDFEGELNWNVIRKGHTIYIMGFSKNHRITESPRLEKTHRITQYNHPPITNSSHYTMSLNTRTLTLGVPYQQFKCQSSVQLQWRSQPSIFSNPQHQEVVFSAWSTALFFKKASLWMMGVEFHRLVFIFKFIFFVILLKAEIRQPSQDSQIPFRNSANKEAPAVTSFISRYGFDTGQMKYLLRFPVRSWTQWTLWIPSNSGYSMILTLPSLIQKSMWPVEIYTYNFQTSKAK